MFIYCKQHVCNNKLYLVVTFYTKEYFPQYCALILCYCILSVTFKNKDFQKICDCPLPCEAYTYTSSVTYGAASSVNRKKTLTEKRKKELEVWFYIKKKHLQIV